MKITKKILSLTLWLGRSTATIMGLAMLIALTVGLASTALAGTGIGAKFNLGKTNTVNQVSKLIGSVAGPSLLIDNNFPGAKGAPAPALALNVEASNPPLSVNPESGTATDLSADELDGKDSSAFFPANTYFESSDAVTGQGGGTPLVFVGVPCDPGDKILNAGGAANPEDDMVEERPVGSAAWLVRIRDNGARTDSTVVANCVDFPPLR